MAETLTFLHAADLHLGAPLRGLRALSGKWADRVADAIPAAFDALVDTALERQVDFVLFAGDIFDQAQPSYANYVRFAAGLERLDAAGIPSYLCTGNHDPYTSWRNDLVDLPASAYMFPAEKPGFIVHKRGGKPLALLGGRGFYTKVFDNHDNIAAGITRAAAEEACHTTAPFAIGLIHTGLNIDTFKAPTNPKDLLRAGMNYWALGHIHQPWLDEVDDPHMGFSGCIQGRDVRETGARGCFVVTLEEGKANQCEFVPLASVVWEQLDVDISGCSTILQAQAAMSQELFRANGAAHCDSMVVRIRLVGQTALHTMLQQPGILDDLRAQLNEAHDSFFCDSLRDVTTAPFNRHALLEDGLFPAVLLAAAQELEGRTEESVQYLQDEFLARNLVLPRRVYKDLESMQEAACEQALDALHCGVNS